MATQAPTGVEVIDDAWDRCEELVEYLNSLDSWDRSRVQGDTSVVDYRTSDTIGLPFNSPDNPTVLADFTAMVAQKMSNYSFVYGVPTYGYEDIVFNRYQPGQSFATHPDYYRGSDRVFSAVVYLNTVTSGGATSFVHYGYRVEPIAGRMVMFPANYLFAHAGEAPTTDIKYSAAIWARG